MDDSDEPTAVKPREPRTRQEPLRDDSERMKRASERAEQSKINFSRKLSLSRSLSNATPARFRIASGRAEFGASFRTDENSLSGWILVQKRKPDGRKMWRWRFIEVTRGLMEIFKTGPPVNYMASNVSEVRLKFPDQRSMAVEFSLQDSEIVIKLSSEEKADKIRMIANKVIAKKLGDEVDASNNFMTTVLNDSKAKEPILLSWNGSDGLLSLFEKTHLQTVPLKGLVVVTAEVQTFVKGAGSQHQLAVRNSDGDEIVMTVPDSLVLLQWCGAISQSDVAPLKNDSREASDRVFSSSEDLFKKVIVDGVVQAPRTKNRSVSFGLTEALGINPQDSAIPKKVDIKIALANTPDLPDMRGKSMRAMMHDSVMRKFVYQWSKTQYCDESVKFLTAVDRLKSLTGAEDRAQGLIKLSEDYISNSGVDSLNIAGSSRKRIVKQIKDSESDAEALSQLLTGGILNQPVEETIRVLEFDLHPQFCVLLEEVFELRAEMAQSRSSSPEPSSSSPPSTSASAAGKHPLERSPRTSLVLENESPKDSIDLSKIKSIRDCPDSMLQHVIVFCSEKIDQDSVLFVSLVVKYKSSDDATRKNMSQNLVRQFLDSSSPSFLPYLDTEKRMHTITSLQEKLLCPPTSLFDLQLGEVYFYVTDAGLWKRFVKSRMPEKRKKGLFKTIGKKQSRSFNEGKRASRSSFSAFKEDKPL